MNMSLAASMWAYTLPMSRCSGAPHRVLLLLADQADEYGRGAYPGVYGMSKTLGCSPRTVQRALRELQDEGLIRRGDQRLVDHYRDDRRPVVWDCLTPAVLSGAGSQPVDNSRSRGDRYVTP